MDVLLSVVGSVTAVGIIGLVGVIINFNGRLAKVETMVCAIQKHLEGE